MRKCKDEFRDGGEAAWKADRIAYFAEQGWTIIFVEGTSLNEEKVSGGGERRVLTFPSYGKR